MGLYWACSENTPWKGTSFCSANQTAVIVALGSRRCVAGLELSVLQIPVSTAEEMQQTLYTWMQSTSLDKLITGKGAVLLPFSDHVFSPSCATSPNCLSTSWFCNPGCNSWLYPQSRETVWKCHCTCTLGHEFGVHVSVLSMLIGVRHPLAGPRWLAGGGLVFWVCFLSLIF